jgi:hypothetical protein
MSNLQAALLVVGGIVIGVLAAQTAIPIPAKATAGGYAIAADASPAAAWRVNTETGSLWFCTAGKIPQCLLAQEVGN